MVFEGNRVLNIGCTNNYPDTFVNLAEEIIELTNEDVLKLDTISDDRVYEKYAKKHFRE